MISSSRSPLTTSGNTRVSSEDEEGSESGEVRKVIRWTDVEKEEEEEEEENDKSYQQKDNQDGESNSSSSSSSSDNSSGSASDRTQNKVQPSNTSRPTTRSYVKSIHT